MPRMRKDAGRYVYLLTVKTEEEPSSVTVYGTADRANLALCKIIDTLCYENTENNKEKAQQKYIIHGACSLLNKHGKTVSVKIETKKVY